MKCVNNVIGVSVEEEKKSIWVTTLAQVQQRSG